MAVDANILIFERMKEEIRLGRTLASAMEVGFNRAWPAIRDGNVSTIITCGVLLWFGSRLGGGLINGFALSLLIGVIISMFTAVVVSRNLLQLLSWVGFSKRINLFTPEGARPAAQAPGRPQAARGGR
jgi:preprotein translocase subunit SecD